MNSDGPLSMLEVVGVEKVEVEEMGKIWWHMTDQVVVNVQVGQSQESQVSVQVGQSQESQVSVQVGQSQES